MKLNETEKKLRDEIAKELYIRKAPDRTFDELFETAQGSFDAAEEFLRAQNKEHENDRRKENKEWEGGPL